MPLAKRQMFSHVRVDVKMAVTLTWISMAVGDRVLIIMTIITAGAVEAVMTDSSGAVVGAMSVEVGIATLVVHGA